MYFLKSTTTTTVCKTGNVCKPTNYVAPCTTGNVCKPTNYVEPCTTGNVCKPTNYGPIDFIDPILARFNTNYLGINAILSSDGLTLVFNGDGSPSSMIAAQYILYRSILKRAVEPGIDKTNLDTGYYINKNTNTVISSTTKPLPTSDYYNWVLTSTITGNSMKALIIKAPISNNTNRYEIFNLSSDVSFISKV